MNKRLSTITVLLIVSGSAEAHGDAGISWAIGVMAGLLLILILSLITIHTWKLKPLPVLLSIPIPMLIGMAPSAFIKTLDIFPLSVGFWPMFISGAGGILITHNLRALTKKPALLTLVTFPYFASLIGVVAFLVSLYFEDIMQSKFDHIYVGNTKEQIYSYLGNPDTETGCSIDASRKNDSLINLEPCFREGHYLNRLANREWVVRFSKQNRLVSTDIYLSYSH